ncbi:MAG TPA: S8 family serine peptidase [Candidatus Mediterraneibacter caccavium]|uniref:S8 family serine peptidase n=1 Tax=Candidatus Mediterraneibacter caccavium TaxID=2838661 RepID=A0A9D1VWJ8_9FIRM|nr:S8 family peptidase [Lachnoclostridium sp. An76]OUN34013.1 peptidase S8 [Lachnoclostridium sp. An76]HIX48381.1 S8 family serine peptidase [Candidatus Mediterraneibacter caccavium]
MSQKIENILNLALEATPEERERSGELETGYDPGTRAWELIVKYSGTLEAAREIAVSVTELMNGYAVVVIREERIGELAGLTEIEFIEKPKSLYFEAEAGRQASCIDAVQFPPYSLSGQGILIGVVDSGIDYAHPAFRNEDGTTRIAALWDQTIPGSPPEGYASGTEFTREEINTALTEPEERERYRIVPSRDMSGHGTAVAGIAAGNGAGSEGQRYRGAAPEAELIVVKMGAPQTEGFPRTTELMTGVDYVIRKALELKKPVAVNISFGNTYGSHDGTSLVERFLNDISDTWKNVICVGSGNEGTSAGHAAGRVSDEEEKTVELAVQQMEPSLNVQIWKSYVDEMDISVVDPSGTRIGPFREILGPQRFVLGGTELLIYYGEPKPYSVKQEIYLSFIPRESYIDSGVWKLVLTPRRIVDGSYQMWLPAQEALNVGTAFLLPNSSSTLTIPSTASLVVTVAAYDARTFSYADFSGRGPAAVYEGSGVPKPDLAAPGVRVNAPVPGGGYRAFSGTSFAAPFVTGSAALLMEWGIVRGNDPYLYGEKVKAYLRRGARELPGYSEWPNAQLGYGALCVRDSLPDG